MYRRFFSFLSSFLQIIRFLPGTRGIEQFYFRALCPYVIVQNFDDMMKKSTKSPEGKLVEIDTRI